jgi:hypothetical protein
MYDWPMHCPLVLPVSPGKVVEPFMRGNAGGAWCCMDFIGWSAAKDFGLQKKKTSAAFLTCAFCSTTHF